MLSYYLSYEKLHNIIIHQCFHFSQGIVSIQNINLISILFSIVGWYKFLLHFDMKSVEEINSLWNGSRFYIHSYAKLIIFNVEYNKSYKKTRSSFCQSTIKADRFPCQSLAVYSISGNQIYSPCFYCLCSASKAEFIRKLER